MAFATNSVLIQVLKDTIFRERERISRAEEEITKLKFELVEAGADPEEVDLL